MNTVERVDIVEEDDADEEHRDDVVGTRTLLRQILATVGRDKSRPFFIKILRSMYAINLHRPNPVQDQMVPKLLSNHWRNLLIRGPPGSGKTLSYLLTVPCYIDRMRPCVQVLCVCSDANVAAQTGRVAAKILREHRMTLWVATSSSWRLRHLQLRQHVVIVTPMAFRMWTHRKAPFAWHHLRLLIFDEVDQLSPAVTPTQRRNCRMVFVTGECDRRKLSKSMMRLPTPKHYLSIQGPPVGDNVKLIFMVCTSESEKFHWISEYMEKMPRGAIIVCCRTMERVNTIRIGLTNEGCDFALLEPFMSATERKEVLDVFRKGFVRLLILMDSLRGNDIPLVKHVIHFDLECDRRDRIDRVIFLQRTRLAAKSNRINYAVTFIQNDRDRTLHRTFRQAFHVTSQQLFIN